MFRSKKILFFLWIVSTLIGTAAFITFVQGVIRDTHFGDPEISIDLHTVSDRQSSLFRVWGESEYDIALSTVIQRTGQAGMTFGGMIEVRILDPDGNILLNRTYPPRNAPHVTRDNFAWTTFDRIPLNDLPFKQWDFQVRVVEVDKKFIGTKSSIHLRKQRYDPGMGGMMNYIMLFPAVIFSIAGFGAGLKLKSAFALNVPFLISGGILVVILLMIFFR